MPDLYMVYSHRGDYDKKRGQQTSIFFLFVTRYNLATTYFQIYFVMSFLATTLFDRLIPMF